MDDGSVAVVRRMYEMWNEGDIDDALREYWHEDAVLEFPEDFLESGPWMGRAAIAAHFHRLREDFTQQHASALDPEVHGDWILVRNVWKIRGDRSGVEGQTTTTAIFRIVDGKVARARYFVDRDEALEAIGARR
jgi:ketosteroid isomerase-like protein